MWCGALLRRESQLLDLGDMAVMKLLVGTDLILIQKHGTVLYTRLYALSKYLGTLRVINSNFMIIFKHHYSKITC